MRHLLFYPDDPGGAGEANAPAPADSKNPFAANAFPDLKNVRPDLGLPEEAFKAGKEEKGSQPTDKPPEPEVRTAESQEVEAPAKESPETNGETKATGKDEPSQEPASEVEETPPELLGILEKFDFKPNRIANAYRELQRGFTAKSEERKALAQKWSSAADYFDEVDGKLVLRTDVATRVLRERGEMRPQAPDGEFVEAATRRKAEGELTKALLETMDREDVAEVVKSKSMQAQIDERVAQEKDSHDQRKQSADIGVLTEVATIYNGHFANHPKDKALVPKIDAFYESFPHELRARAITEGWGGGIGQIAANARREAQFEEAIQEAWKTGVKYARTNIEPTDGAPPAGAGTQTGKRRGAEDPDAELKKAILEAGVMPGMESLRSP